MDVGPVGNDAGFRDSSSEVSDDEVGGVTPSPDPGAATGNDPQPPVDTFEEPQDGGSGRRTAGTKQPDPTNPDKDLFTPGGGAFGRDPDRAPILHALSFSNHIGEMAALAVERALPLPVGIVGGRGEDTFQRDVEEKLRSLRELAGR